MICVGRPALPIRGTICFTVAGSTEELIIEHSIIFNQLHGRGIEYHFCLLSILQLFICMNNGHTSRQLLLPFSILSQKFLDMLIAINFNFARKSVNWDGYFGEKKKFKLFSKFCHLVLHISGP